MFKYETNPVYSGWVPSESLSDCYMLETDRKKEYSIKWGQFEMKVSSWLNKQLHSLENEFITERNSVGLVLAEIIGQE